METQFFIIEGGQQVGPLTKMQLAMRRISPQTMVWRQGLADWTQASNLPELTNLFHTAPPFNANQAYNNPYQQGNNPYGRTPSYHKNWLNMAIIATIVGALFSCIGMIFGIIAINKSNEANRYYIMGDDMNGDLANNSAKTNVTIALVLAGIGLIANIGILSTGIL